MVLQWICNPLIAVRFCDGAPQTSQVRVLDIAPQHQKFRFAKFYHIEYNIIYG